MNAQSSLIVCYNREGKLSFQIKKEFFCMTQQKIDYRIYEQILSGFPIIWIGYFPLSHSQSVYCLHYIYLKYQEYIPTICPIVPRPFSAPLPSTQTTLQSTKNNMSYADTMYYEFQSKYTGLFRIICQFHK